MNADDVAWIRWIASLEAKAGNANFAAKLELLADMAQERARGQDSEKTPKLIPTRRPW